MSGTPKFVLFTFLLIALAAPLWSQGSYTAASCNQSDVNAVINGPTHTAVDGDVINIPSGSCTWTTGIVVPSNIGISIIGAGSNGQYPIGSGTTTIIDNYTSSASWLFYFNPSYGNSTSQISSLIITPASGVGANSLKAPIAIEGQCTSSGCPNFRADHLVFPSGSYPSGSGYVDWGGLTAPSTTLIVTDNVYGVLDHNSIYSTGANTFEFVNFNHSSWLGVGSYGDNSWAQPDTFGTAQALYVETNYLQVTGTVNLMPLTETEGGVVAGTGQGGGRVVCRFNTSVGARGLCNNHGTESNGRPRGGRQMEFYDNSMSCPTSASTVCFNSGGLLNGAGIRSGSLLSLGNSFTWASGTGMNQFASISEYRALQNISNPWEGCDGSGPYDKNDGTPYFSGYIYSLTGSNPYALTISSTYPSFTNPGWSANEWISNGSPYSVHDTTITTGSDHNGSEIASESGTNNNILTVNAWTSIAYAAGDSIQILRAPQCIDQTSRIGGSYLSGSTPSPTNSSGGYSYQTLDPVYEAGDVGSGATSFAYVNSDTARIIANRDFYYEVSQSAQSSTTLPFNGTSGTGFGTYANIPSTCTTGVGYWATDQGSWNASGSGGQGELFICASTNTWTLYYTPYTYPHPLIVGSAQSGTSIQGNVKLHGAVTLGQVAGAQSYSARSDTCTDGTQSDCTCTTLGSSCLPGVTGHPLAYRNESTASAAPVANQPYWRLPWSLGANNSPPAMNSAGTDVDFNAYMVIASDPNLANVMGIGGTNWWNTTFNTGDGGDSDLFSRNASLVFGASDGGQNFILYIDTVNFLAHNCTTSAPCIYYTGIKNGSYPPTSTTLDPGGAEKFSRSQSDPPNTFFERLSDGVTVNKVTINGLPGCATGANNCTLTRVPYVIFNSNIANGGPVDCSAIFPTAPSGGNDRVSGGILPSDYVPGWQSGIGSGDDDSVGFVEAGAGLWHAGTTYTNPDSFVTHAISSSKHCAFQALTTGTSGSTEPWTGISSCPADNTVTTESTGLQWISVLDSAGNGGTVLDNQGDGFDVVSYSPTNGCSRINTRLGKFYRGLNWTPGGASTGYVYTTSYAACQNMAATFAAGAVTVNGGLTQAAWTASLTGVGGTGSCTTTSCQCITIDSGTIHDGGHGMNPYQMAFTFDGGEGAAGGEFTNVPGSCVASSHAGPSGQILCGNMYWLPYLAANPTMEYLMPCVIGASGSHCVGHEAIGWALDYKDKTQVSHYAAMTTPGTESPNCPSPEPYCNSQPTGTANPGVATISGSLPGDHHGSSRWQTPVPDVNPIFLAQTDVPSSGRRNNGVLGCNTGAAGCGYYGSYNVPFYDEDIATNPNGDLVVQRFNHNYNTGTNIHFSAQNAMGTQSTDGRLWIFTSDVMGQRGSLSLPWTLGTEHYGGDIVNPNPLQGNGTNTGHFSYQWQVQNGTGINSTGSEPNWGSCQTVGCTVTETGGSGIVWTAVGAPCANIRADNPWNNATTYQIGDNVTVGIPSPSNNQIFTVASCTSSPCVSASTNAALSSCAAYGNCATLDNNIQWFSLGGNDCRADMILVDLYSAN